MTPQRYNRLRSVLDRRQFDITIVLENVFDPHNISAVMRTCDAVGIQEIYVLNTTIPQHEKWGARSSSSAHKWITVHQYVDVDECMRQVQKQYSRVLTTHMSQQAMLVHEVDFTLPVALVFGNEHGGLSNEILRYSQGNFLIPMHGIIQSLNISVACAVTVYEALRQRTMAGQYENPTRSEQYYKLEQQWDLLDNAKID